MNTYFLNEYSNFSTTACNCSLRHAWHSYIYDIWTGFLFFSLNLFIFFSIGYWYALCLIMLCLFAPAIVRKMGKSAALQHRFSVKWKTGTVREWAPKLRLSVDAVLIKRTGQQNQFSKKELVTASRSPEKNWFIEPRDFTNLGFSICQLSHCSRLILFLWLLKVR